MDYYLRPLRVEDIPQVSEIEREGFPTTWPPTSFRRELENRLARYLVACARNPGAASSKSLVDPDRGEERPMPAEGLPLLPRLLGRLWRLLLRNERPQAGGPPRELVVGYLGVWFMTDEAHVTSIAVRGRHRRLGIGELLLQGAIELGMARKARCVTLEVRVSNSPAQALYEKYAFRKAGVRKGYYADNHEDALVMTTDTLSSPQYQELFAQRVDAFRRLRGEAARTLA